MIEILAFIVVIVIFLIPAYMLYRLIEHLDKLIKKHNQTLKEIYDELEKGEQ